MRPLLSEMRRKGANVAIVGNGLPAMAKAFVDRLKLAGEARVLAASGTEAYVARLQQAQRVPRSKRAAPEPTRVSATPE